MQALARAAGHWGIFSAMAAPVRYQLAPPTFVQLSADAEAGVGGLTFSVLTYNILAQAYVRKASFPTTPHSLLRWKHRKDAVVGRSVAVRARKHARS